MYLGLPFYFNNHPKLGTLESLNTHDSSCENGFEIGHQVNMETVL